MAEDIQGLLEKIHTDGIQKAETEKAAIIASAREEAARIIAAAKAEAETYTNKAKQEAEASEKKAAEVIRQAARDTVIALKADLLAKLNNVAHACIADAMTPEMMEQLILEMAKTYAADTGSVELLLPQKEQDKAATYLKAKLLEKLKAQPVINLTNDFNSGLQISFRDSDVYFDFSDDALAEIICRFVGPKLAAVIKG